MADVVRPFCKMLKGKSQPPMTARKGLSVLLGAGFSKWAAGLPVASELFDFTIEPFGIRETERLAEIRRVKSLWDAKNADRSAEEFIAFALAEQPELRRATLWYLGRRFCDPYIWTEWHAGKRRRHVIMIDENRKFDRPGVVPVRDFLVQLGEVTGLLTTNYDLLVEYALGTKKMNYGVRDEVLTGRGAYPVSQWANPVTLVGSVSVAKMHGSVSWDENARYTDGRRGLTGEALIVAPTPEKGAPDSLRKVWDLAARILNRSDRLVVFGFAFNPYDEALLEHLAGHGRSLRHVAVIDIRPNLERVARVWPRAIAVALRPPPAGLPDLNRWLRSTR